MNHTALQAITQHEANALVAGQARLHAFTAGRLQQVASIRTRRAVATAQADVMQSAMEAWMETIYGDLRYHIHPYTFAIQIPAPWSRTHHRHYGLSEPQGRLLACLVQDVIAMLPARRQLFVYDGINRWQLNKDRFPTLATALEWLRGPCRLSPDAVLEGWVRYPHGRRIVPPTGQSTGQSMGR